MKVRNMGMLLLTGAGCGLWAAACSSEPPVGSIEQPLCNCDAEIPPCCCTSPILIDVAGDGFRLTSWVDGVEFAPRPGFRPSARAWTEANSDDAWLVLDRDGDGVINDGSEMFGNATPQPQPADGTLRNGFLALAQYDDDGSGTIDEHDAIFPELRLWQDRDHDGVSQPAELHTLPELGVAGVSLAYTAAREVDQHGNSFRYRAAVYGTLGSPVGMTAWDVWLVGVRPEPVAGFREADSDSSGCGGGGPGPKPDRKVCGPELGVQACLDCCYYNYDHVDGWECRKKRNRKAKKDCWDKAIEAMSRCQVDDCNRHGIPPIITTTVP
jgi:hypothetical protein